MFPVRPLPRLPAQLPYLFSVCPADRGCFNQTRWDRYGNVKASAPGSLVAVTFSSGQRDPLASCSFLLAPWGSSCFPLVGSELFDPLSACFAARLKEEARHGDVDTRGSLRHPASSRMTSIVSLWAVAPKKSREGASQPGAGFYFKLSESFRLILPEYQQPKLIDSSVQSNTVLFFFFFFLSFLLSNSSTCYWGANLEAGICPNKYPQQSS